MPIKKVPIRIGAMILKTLGILTAITFAILLFANDIDTVSTANKLLAPLVVLTCLFGIRPLVDYLKKHGTFDDSGNASGDSTGSHGDSNCSTDNSSGDCGGGDGGGGGD